MSKLAQNEVRLLAVIAILAVLGSATFFASHKKLADMRREYEDERRSQEALTAFFGATDNAKAVYVYDATNKKVLFERNADAELPLASVTKLATALTAQKLFGPDAEITLSAKDLAVEGDNGLVLGEKWQRDQLLGLMLVVSSNDAAFAFKNNFDASGEQHDFVKEMNNYVKGIGLEHTIFTNPAGLDLGGQIGGLGTAKDMSTLILSFLTTMPDLALETIQPQQTFRSEDAKGNGKGLSHTVSNTNDLSAHIDSLLASKTGYTNLAGGNLAIAYRMPIYGNTIVIVVLGSTREGRFVDIERYMEGVENYFKISKK